MEVPNKAMAGIERQNIPKRWSSEGGEGRRRTSYWRKMTHASMASMAYAPTVVGQSMINGTVTLSYS